MSESHVAVFACETSIFSSIVAVVLMKLIDSSTALALAIFWSEVDLGQIVPDLRFVDFARLADVRHVSLLDGFLTRDHFVLIGVRDR